MTARAQTESPFWRWVLIVSELLVGAYLAAIQIGGRDARPETGAFLGVGALAFVASIFLLFGSPFLVPSQRWLAIVGWFIAVAALFFSVL